MAHPRRHDDTVRLAAKPFYKGERIGEWGGRIEYCRMCHYSQEAAEYKLSNSERLRAIEYPSKPLSESRMIGRVFSICVDENVYVS